MRIGYAFTLKELTTVTCKLRDHIKLNIPFFINLAEFSKVVCLRIYA